MTNNHVVERVDKIIVGTADGRTFQADKIYRDTVTDLAVVWINATGLAPARIGDSSQLRLGDWVVSHWESSACGQRASHSSGNSRYSGA